MSLLTPMLRSSPLTDWFSDAQRVQGMLDFEAALAQAQADCGLVPLADSQRLPACAYRFRRAGTIGGQRRQSGYSAG